MSELIRYDAACRALAECKAVDEVKEWADKAAAMQAYGRMAKDKTLEVDAAEIRIRAERRLGQMLAEQRALGGMNRGVQMAGTADGVSALVIHEGRELPRLADSGISYDLSSRAQKLAAVPDSEFEAEVGEWRERVSAEGERVSARLERAGEKAMGRPPKPAVADLRDERIAELEAQLTELRANLAETLADNESMAKTFEADEKLAASEAENQRLRAEVSVLRQRVNGLMNEKNEAVRAAKAWQRKCEKAAHV